MFKEDTNKFYRNLGTKNIEARKLPSMAEVQNLVEVTVGRKSTVWWKNGMNKKKREMENQ